MGWQHMHTVSNGSMNIYIYNTSNCTLYMYSLLFVKYILINMSWREVEWLGAISKIFREMSSKKISLA